MNTIMKKSILTLLMLTGLTVLWGQGVNFPDQFQGNWFKSDGSGDWIAGFHKGVLVWEGKVFSAPSLELKGKTLKINIPGTDQILFVQSQGKGKLKLGTDPRNLTAALDKPVYKADYLKNEPEVDNESFFKRGSANLTGYIKGYVKKAQETGKLAYVDLITGDEVSVPVLPDSTGQFTASVPLNHPQLVRGQIGGRFRTLLLEPGKDLFVFIDGKEMQFMGSSARINRELTDVAGIQSADLYQMIAKMMAMSWPEFRQWSLDWVQARIDSLQKFAGQRPLSNRIMEIKRKEISFPSYGYVITFPEAKKGLSAMYKPEYKDSAFQPGEGFFSFVRESGIDDPSSMVVGAGFYTLMSELGTQNAKFYSEFQKVLSDRFGFTGTLLPDLLYAQRIAFRLGNDLRPLSDAEADSVATYIKEPAIRNRVIEYSQEQSAKAEAIRIENLSKTGYYLPEVPAADGEVILDSIVARYPGKVVFVDFWATWCGPCRAGMERMKPMKKDFEGQDIVFVYITDPSSPLATWNRMIPDIKGYHYRLDEKTVAVLYKKFEIKTIPRYMLFDRKGQMVNNDLGSTAYSNESLKPLLEQYLR